MARTAKRKGQQRTTLKAERLKPTTISELKQCIEPGVHVPFALRPRGGNTASTDCNTSVSGLVIETSGLDRISPIDTENFTVTAEAGVRLEDLVNELDALGLELPGCYDLYRHTVGGAVAAPCFGAGIGDDAATLSRRILSMRVVTPDGKLVRIKATDTQHMPLFRASYGLLGIIADVTFRVRQKRAFTVKYKKLSIDDFVRSVSTFAKLPIGLKFYLMPHRDRAYFEIMRPSLETDRVSDRAWKMKDIGESVVLPALFRSIHKVVPLKQVKYRLIDGMSGFSRDLGQNRFLETGTYSVSAAHRQNGESSSTPLYTTWCFPARHAAEVCRAYTRFCRSAYDATGFRPDLPTVGFRVSQDRTALMSPSRHEDMIAIQTSSNAADGWEDFVIDLADFAEHMGGIPVFNQTRSVRAAYAQDVYGEALMQFARIRRQLDPNNRLLNPFLAQYFT